MTRGWISSALLPPPFWWFAFKRAVEVSNYVPIRIDNNITTRHELVFKTKPDLRSLLPMFSVCYVRKYKNLDDEKLINVENHSLAVILVGRSKIANSPIFFHPHSKKLITSDDFYVDETLPAGPAFDISYASGIHMNSYAELNVYLRSPTFKPQQDVFVQVRDVFHPVKVITIPTRENNIYTLQLQHDKSMHQFSEDKILDHNPYIHPENDPTKNNYFPNWLKHGANITMKLEGSQKYQHCTLQKVNEQLFLSSWAIREKSFNPSTQLRNSSNILHSGSFASESPSSLQKDKRRAPQPIHW